MSIDKTATFFSEKWIFLVSMGRMGVFSTINRINSDVVIGNG